MSVRTKPRQQTCGSCGKEYGWRSTVCPRCRTEKLCTGCDEIKPLESFALNRLGSDGRQWRCMECRGHEERLRRFGLTRDGFEEMLRRQGGLCPLCGTDQPGGRNNQWHVDHDHATGRIRGLLCCGCNIQLGIYEKFSSNPRLKEYLG